MQAKLLKFHMKTSLMFYELTIDLTRRNQILSLAFKSTDICTLPAVPTKK